jgi:hypothetical protein
MDVFEDWRSDQFELGTRELTALAYSRESKQMTMQRSLLSLFLLLAFLSFAREAMGKTWRGIVPLRSTRADVVRLFGACSDADDSCEFEVGNEEVSIVFSDEDSECSKAVRRDTVLSIRVAFAKPTTFKSFTLKNRGLRVFDISPGRRGYINDQEGLIVKTDDDGKEIFELHYIAAAKDASLCSGYYEEPQSFIRFRGCQLPPPVKITSPTEKTEQTKIEFTAFVPDGV